MILRPKLFKLFFVLRQCHFLKIDYNTSNFTIFQMCNCSCNNLLL